VTESAPSVLAVILTFSAPAALRGCVEAVVAQTRVPDEVLVVDNAGQPAASVTLRELSDADSRIRVVTTTVNGGPAGGHALGLEQFLASPHQIAWVMDDDCVPEADCLAHLLHGGADVTTYRFPTWLDREGVVANNPAWCGFVIGRGVVERVGLPMRELFWWGEDTEYLWWRIPAAGIPFHRVEEARVLHLRVRATPRRPAWKYYYEARNTVFLRLRHRRHRGFRRILRVLARLIGRIVLREDHRARKLALVARGVFDGVRGRLGAQVPPSAVSAGPTRVR
jgi:rhamnopyranosyl-N-acetylglucosaminyl-diphospho-decaprenol beta-1,3/1,4-galactofuranosyltransferase